LSRTTDIEQVDESISHLVFAIDLAPNDTLKSDLKGIKNNNLRKLLEALVKLEVHQVSFLFNTELQFDPSRADELRHALDEEFQVLESELGSQTELSWALDYSAREDIVAAVRALATEGGSRDPASLEQGISERLLFGTGSEPDLIIYFGDKKRIGKSSVWFGAYSEFVFESKQWPEFLVQDCKQVLDNYTCRERRFGALQEE